MSRSEFSDAPRHLDLIFEALSGNPHGYKAGQDAMVLCPAHADRNPSLHLTVKSGKVLLFKCMAGCEQEQVRAALQERGLWPGGNSPGPVPPPKTVRREPPKAPADGFDLWGFDKLYDYRDERGALIFQVARYSRPHKTFRQRRPVVDNPDDNDPKHWAWKLKDDAGTWQVRPALYRLPDVLSAPKDEWVVLCEGERDADNVRALGFVATTVPMGTGKWMDHYGEWLKGRRVAILEDYDPVDGRSGKRAGEEGAKRLLDAVKKHTKMVRLVSFRHLPEGSDVSDAVEKHGLTGEGLRRMIEDARASWEPPSTLLQTLTQLLRKKLPPGKWAVQGMVPEGCTLLIAPPKVGKTLFCQGLSVAVASGGRALGTTPVEQGDVLYLCLEDGEQLIQERYMQLLEDQRRIPQEDTDRVHVAFEWPRVDAGGVEGMEEWVKEHPEARLIIVDTLQMVRPLQNGNAHSVYQDDYAAALPIKELAKRYRVPIIIVHHSRKMAAEDALDTASGSRGLTGVVDGALVLSVNRREGEAMLTVIGKRSGFAEIDLKWNRDTLQWVMEEGGSERQISEEREDIIDAIIENGSPMKAPAIARLLNKNFHTTRNLIQKMREDGMLARDGNVGWKVDPTFLVEFEKSRSTRSTDSDLPHEDAKSPYYAPPTSRSHSRSTVVNIEDFRTTADYGTTTPDDEPRSTSFPHDGAENGDSYHEYYGISEKTDHEDDEGL